MDLSPPVTIVTRKCVSRLGIIFQIHEIPQQHLSLHKYAGAIVVVVIAQKVFLFSSPGILAFDISSSHSKTCLPPIHHLTSLSHSHFSHSPSLR
jgi:hypothetical protein